MAASRVHDLAKLLGRRPDRQAVHVWLEDRICTPRLGRLAALVFGDRIPHRGHRISTDVPSVSPEVKASILVRLYERREINLVRRYLRPELDVVDAGASLGVTAIVAASRLRAERRLIAVEANPALIPTLRRNLESAVGEGRAIVLHGALSGIATSEAKEAALATFRAGPDSLLGAVTDGSGPGEPVPAVSLDALRRAWRLDRYALICDVEGSEWDVIREPAGVFAGCEQLFIELHGRAGDVGTEWLLRRLIDVHGFLSVEWHGRIHYLKREHSQA